MFCQLKVGITTFLGVALSCCLVSDVLGATNYVEGEVIITFKPSAGLMSTEGMPGHRQMKFTRRFNALSQKRGRQFGVVRGTNQTTAALIAELQQDPSVETVEPNYLRRVTGSVPPNDPFVPEMWGLQNTGQGVNGTVGTSGADIKFMTAWPLARPTTNSIVVGIIDTGVYYTHPDLASNMWVNPGEIPGNSVDDDGNGFVDDVYGWNFSDGNANPTDSGHHGTHVAGTVAASGNNQMGVIGVDFQAKIMALRASSDGQYLSDSAIIGAIDYAILMKSRGVNIVALNASFGGPDFSSAEKAAVQSAGDAGIVFCAAAGNDWSDNDSIPAYPASFRLTNMIVVAATDEYDDLAWFSNYGDNTVDLAAPGVDILSASPPTTSAADNYLGALVRQGGSNFNANGLTFANTNDGVTATIYDCGIGNSGEFPAPVNGNIALIQRGTLTFAEKVSNAMAAGARAAIIYNNASGNFLGTLGSSGSWIPAVSISQADGLALKALLPTTGTVVHSSIYQYLDGTSMATPHVAGAVAFAAMNFPSDTVTQRVQRVIASVDVLPSLAGLVVTGGRLNLRRLVDADTNSLPDWWEQTYFGQPTGIDPDADPDGDGPTTMAEWVADTNPTNALSFLHILSVSNDVSSATLVWGSSTNRSYFVQRAPEVPGGSFQTITTNLTGQAGTTAYTDSSIGTNAALYYRIGVVQ